MVPTGRGLPSLMIPTHQTGVYFSEQRNAKRLIVYNRSQGVLCGSFEVVSLSVGSAGGLDVPSL
eukprot:scaffold8028_cov165-Amphora_coffeaeformis.AAC.14